MLCRPPARVPRSRGLCPRPRPRRASRRGPGRRRRDGRPRRSRAPGPRSHAAPAGRRLPRLPQDGPSAVADGDSAHGAVAGDRRGVRGAVTRQWRELPWERGHSWPVRRPLVLVGSRTVGVVLVGDERTDHPAAVVDGLGHRHVAGAYGQQVHLPGGPPPADQLLAGRVEAGADHHTALVHPGGHGRVEADAQPDRTVLPPEHRPAWPVLSWTIPTERPLALVATTVPPRPPSVGSTVDGAAGRGRARRLTGVPAGVRPGGCGADDDGCAGDRRADDHEPSAGTTWLTWLHGEPPATTTCYSGKRAPSSHRGPGHDMARNAHVRPGGGRVSAAAAGRARPRRTAARGTCSTSGTAASA